MLMLLLGCLLGLLAEEEEGTTSSKQEAHKKTLVGARRAGPTRYVKRLYL